MNTIEHILPELIDTINDELSVHYQFDGSGSAVGSRCQVQGYLAHKKQRFLGTCSKTMLRVLWGS